MPICNPSDLKSAIRKGQRLLGLDVGTKTVGMALSDTGLMVGSPLATIRRTRFREDAAGIFAEVDRHDVGAIVIGLPLALDGHDSPRTQSVRQFARNLIGYRDLPVAFWDERLSTAAVERQMIAARRPGRPRRAPGPRRAAG